MKTENRAEWQKFYAFIWGWPEAKKAIKTVFGRKPPDTPIPNSNSHQVSFKERYLSPKDDVAQQKLPIRTLKYAFKESC